MNKKSGWLRRLAPVCCLLALASPAHADTLISGSAQIGDFVFTLVDLDANDGITPAYWFDQAADGPRGYTDGWARTGLPDAGLEQFDAHSQTTYLSQVALTSSRGGVSSTTTVSPSGLSSLGESSRLGSAFLAAARSVTQPIPTGYPYTMWITPNTQLTVSAFASTSAAVGTTCSWKWSTLCGSAHAELSMIGRVIEDGHITQLLTSSLSSDAGLGQFITTGFDGLPLFTVPYFDDGGHGIANSSAGTLSITFVNATAQPSSEYLQLDVGVFAQAVPEPSVWALTLAGLAAGVTLRRRPVSAA